ncbi:MAG: adenylyltransferase/cytidyltransferase family protein [bacterium]|nr:adenylyltransferase/cytidyltransferase family protein [bacterium]
MVVIPRKQRSKDKVIPDRRALALILNGLRASGKTVVLTNGVFDLLHVGHTRCLEDARSRGDYLVVAVNSDKSAQALKGKGRPVLSAAERMEMLSALSFVDYVTVFEEETADGLLEQFQPSFYAKGTDYSLKTLPERDTVKALGIKAVFVGDKKANSTAKLIQKIQKLPAGKVAAVKPAAKKPVAKKATKKAAKKKPVTKKAARS